MSNIVINLKLRLFKDYLKITKILLKKLTHNAVLDYGITMLGIVL